MRCFAYICRHRQIISVEVILTLSEPVDTPEDISDKAAHDVLEKTESQLRAKFAEIHEKTYNSNTKGYNYEETVQEFFSNYLGGAFDFLLRKGVLDAELKALSVFKTSENEFDVVATFKDAVPKLVYEPFVPYDSVAFIIEVKQTLDSSNLKKDLNKLDKLRTFKTGQKFPRYAYPLHATFLKLTRPLRILFCYEARISRQRFSETLDSYKEAWDMLLVLSEDMVLLNTSLPAVPRVFKRDKPVTERPYPLLKAMYFICNSIPGNYVRSWDIFENLFRRIAPK